MKQIFLPKKLLSSAVPRLECPLLVYKYKIRPLPPPPQKKGNINPKLDFIYCISYRKTDTSIFNFVNSIIYSTGK